MPLLASSVSFSSLPDPLQSFFSFPQLLPVLTNLTELFSVVFCRDEICT